MAVCAKCRFVRILKMNSGRRYYVCEYGGAKYQAYGDREQVSCPHFRLLSRPPTVQRVTQPQQIWEIILLKFPPFAHLKEKT